jgi:hypothetical protein
MTGESFRNLYLWSPGAELDACQTRGTACLPYPFVGPAEQTRACALSLRPSAAAPVHSAGATSPGGSRPLRARLTGTARTQRRSR